jgi:hypothetical protein
MRQKMLDHRVRPDCVQCHRLMDPIGFALENFDGIATWRSHDDGIPIDASAELFDNTRVDGPVGLRNWLTRYSDQFVAVVGEKLLTYALGRGVEYQDMPLVRSIARDARRNGNRFSALVVGVVKSKSFQMNMKERLTSVGAPSRGWGPAPLNRVPERRAAARSVGAPQAERRERALGPRE